LKKLIHSFVTVKTDDVTLDSKSTASLMLSIRVLLVTDLAHRDTDETRTLRTEHVESTYLNLC